MTDYEYYKSMGICTYCRKEDALPNRVYCGKCARHLHDYGQAHKEQKNKINREIKARRRQNGLCVICGKSSDGSAYCRECAIIRNAKRWIARRRKRNGCWTGKVFDERAMYIICLSILKKWGMLNDQ